MLLEKTMGSGMLSFFYYETGPPKDAWLVKVAVKSIKVTSDKNTPHFLEQATTEKVGQECVRNANIIFRR